jgi:transcriptional regulator with XRE-family HTH domain
MKDTRLRIELKKQRYTQAALARLLNVNKMNVSNWINGRFIPNKNSAIAISKLLGVSIDELFYRDEVSDGH